MTAYVFKRKRPPVLQYTGDYTKVGSPTIQDNVVSGFSASNYLITKSVFNPLDADFEFVFKIKLDSHAINTILAENRTGQFSKVYLSTTREKTISFRIGTGSAWRMSLLGNTTLELNTDYWIKVVKSNGTFYLYYSLDGKDYILDNSVANTSVFPSISVEGRIGCFKDSQSGTSYFHGSIDLTESYIKLNGEYWWRGAKYVNADKSYVLRKKQYWKKIVTEITKYWKETTTETTELTYACYRFSGALGWQYYYIKTPIGSSVAAYEPIYSNGVAIIPPSSSSDLTINAYHTAGSLTENSCVIFNSTYTRYTAGDLYETVTTTTVVEGTPDDYTYTEVETIENTVPATKDDYDFTTDKAYVLKRKQYWKWDYQDWTQPILTNNTSSKEIILTDPNLSGGTTDDETGVMTWGSSAVTNFSTIWQSMDSDTSNYWTVNKGNKIFSVFDIEFNTPILISGVSIVGNVVSSKASSLTGSQIYSINEEGELTLLSTVIANNTNEHTFESTNTKKIRICARPNADGGTYPTRITEVTLTAKKGVKVKATKDDYDFITD